MEKNINLWKQRHLTIFGKNIIIMALINSLFTFNSQIEIPPVDFLPLVDKKSKEFLWGSNNAKVAHHSIIGDVTTGGLGYKDLQSFIISVNFKTLSK